MKKFNNFIMINIILLTLIASYKLYLHSEIKQFKHYNYQNIDRLEYNTNNTFSFAITDAIETDIIGFKTQVIPAINKDPSIDFVISPGNSVIDGGVTKYNGLYQIIKKIEVPFFANIGNNEVMSDGAQRYFDKFGNYYYSFEYLDTQFIFLDSTGTSDYYRQYEWLKNELEKSDPNQNTFVFLEDNPLETTTEYSHLNQEQSDALLTTFADYDVDYVFYNGPDNEQTIENSINYISTGSSSEMNIAPSSQPQTGYTKVDITNDVVNINYVSLDDDTTGFIRLLNILVNYLISLLYIQSSNIFIILCLTLLIFKILQNKVFAEKSYYRNFEDLIDEKDLPSKLKIAMFTNNYLPFIGGVPISIAQLADELRKQGHEVVIFAPQYPGTTSDNKVVRIKLFHYVKRGNFKFAIANIFSKEYKEIFNQGDFDIVHIHHPFWLGTAGYTLAKRKQIPIVLTYHTRLEHYSNNLPIGKQIFEHYVSHKMIYHFAQKCDGIISPTYSALEYLENIRVGTPKIVSPTGVNFNNYTKPSKTIKLSEKNCVTLCSVSRLSVEKNLDFLIDGILHLKEICDTPFVCNIIGDGPEYGNILRKITEHGLENEIKLLGSIEHDLIANYYTEADIFVFASKSETQGMVLLEAMAGRCPVVCVNGSGVNDVIINNYNGFKTQEHVDTWAKKIKILIEDENKYEQMANNSLLFAQQYSVEKVGSQIIDFYKMLLTRK